MKRYDCALTRSIVQPVESVDRVTLQAISFSIVGRYVDPDAQESLLSESLRREGFAVAEKQEEADVLIVLDLTIKLLVAAIRRRFARKKTYLIIQEPSVVFPFEHWGILRILFTERFKIGFGTRRGWMGVQYPQNLKLFDSAPSEGYRRAALINSNKFSLVRGELYSLRREVSQLDSVDTFGSGWQPLARLGFKECFKLVLDLLASFKLPSFDLFRTMGITAANPLGQVRDKLLTLSEYKVSVAIENSQEYMTEKLLDPILAGSIPVYVGDPLQLDTFPAGLIVVSDPSVRALGIAISEALEMDFDKWLDVRRAWLADTQFSDLYRDSIVWSRVAQRICNPLF
tara:strand:+ start:8699 stop:9727 length:1029 start_codon:yes stop_codon:yes gene_type:complete